MTDYFINFFSGLNLASLTMPKITTTDIMDILMVAYIIYRVMLWIKETRAWALFKGIIILIVISILAYLFKLYTISWLVNNAFSVGLVALIVLFQPELRKALEQIGRGKIIPFNIAGEQTGTAINKDSVNAILKAARTMSNARTGALILIEKDVPLGDHENTGVPLDALISSPLLINIFEDKTPLHDGAVIIRNNRIAAASCILPLTQDEIGKELGTRHRAAVGVSEVCDGYALVVSEETGHISIARTGKLYRNLSDDKIRDMLLTDEVVVKKNMFSRIMKDGFHMNAEGGKHK